MSEQYAITPQFAGLNPSDVMSVASIVIAGVMVFLYVYIRISVFYSIS